MGRHGLQPGELGVPNAKQEEKDRWRAWVRVGLEGGNTAKLERTGRTKAIALRIVQEAAKERVERKQRAEEHAAAEREPSVNDLASQWFRSIEPPKVRVNEFGAQIEPEYHTSVRRQTFNQYERLYRNHIEPALGTMKVSAIGVKICSDFLHGLVDGARGLSTQKGSRVVLSSILELAVEQEILSFNPARSVKLQRKKRIKPKALPPSTVDAVRAGARTWRTSPETLGPANDGWVADVVDLMASTGARIGEVLALQWSNVDLCSNPPIIQIRGTMVEGNGPTFRQHWGKSEGAARDIPIPQIAVDLLLRRRVISPPSNRANAVFWTRNGTHKAPTALRRSLRGVLTESGVTSSVQVTPHAFRRTVATIVAREEGAEAAQSLLGHASLQQTEAAYIERDRRTSDVRETLQRALDGQTLGQGR